MADPTGASVSQESKAEAEASSQGFVRSWCEAIDAASKEEDEWRKQAQSALDVYRGKKGSKCTRFNIFFSNIETICPAVYNSTPEPDVRRRYNDKDPVGKDVAEVVERALSYCVDSYDFDAVMRCIVRDGEIAGRGVPRVRYIPTFAQEPVTGPDNQPMLDEEGEPELEDRVVDEEATVDYVPWKHFRRGPGLLWGHVPWVAFGDYLSKEEVEKLVGVEEAKQVPFNFAVGSNGEYKKADSKEASIFKRAFVWQIWDKETRRVIYISTDYRKKALRVLEDPLGLTGFFPCPRPYQPVMVTDSLTPIVPYAIYEDLVVELNEVTGRIAKLVKQLRPRGLYAGNAADIAAVAEANDGELKPAQMVEAFLNGKGLESAISWFPLDPTVKALVQLVAQREQVKQTIYEVTGIADILRGSTAASETATAQQIKAQWGSVRIQDRQGEVARVARDLFRLKAEIIATKFSTEKLTLMTGIQVTPEMEEVLRNDLIRAYRIDIESDSTIRGDMVRNQQAMAEFINGTAQYANAVAPITAQFPMLAQPLIEVYTAFARQFNLGKQAEDALDSLSDTAREAAENQAPKEPSPQEQVLMRTADRDDAVAQAMIAEKQERLKLDRAKVVQDGLAAGVTPEMAALAQMSQADTQSRLDAMTQSLLQMGQALAAVTSSVNAPRETVVVRGPDGKAIGTRSMVTQNEPPAPNVPGPSAIQ